MDQFIPYKSVGDLQLLMSSADLLRKLGTPICRATNILAEHQLLYDRVVLTFHDDLLVEITIHQVDILSFQGEEITDNQAGRNTLVSLSTERLRGGSAIVLYDLGCALDEFGEGISPITVFAKGRLDDLIDSYEKF